MEPATTASDIEVGLCSLREVLQDLALDEARHFIVGRLDRRRRRLRSQPARTITSAAPSDKSISRLLTMYVVHMCRQFRNSPTEILKGAIHK